MISVIVNLAGIALIIFIIWWFIIKKPKPKRVVNNTVDILVKDGVYEPSLIYAKAGNMLQIRFLREDETPCSEYVVFNDFDVSAKLPLHKHHEITLDLKKPGEFAFACQMGMYRGTLVVE